MHVLILISAMIWSYITCHAQETRQLKIILTNFKTSEGVAIVNLFREKDDIPSKPFKTISSSIVDGKAELVIADLPPGDYAAITFHDRNSNGKLDHKLGLPNEPMGFSNNWHLGLLTGMPTFQKLKFKHGSTGGELLIKID